jgi:alkylhydroperoxidase family enzyme
MMMSRHTLDRPRPPRIDLAAPPYAPAVQAVFDRLPAGWQPPFAIFTALARAPALLQRFTRGAPAYFAETALSLRQREVLLLRVTANCRCEYEWGLRIHYFRTEAGFDDDQVWSTVFGNAEDPCWRDADDRLLIRLADALHASADIPDGLWGELSRRFDTAAILELLLLAGYYRTVGYLANGLRLAPEPAAARFPKAVAA